MTKNEFRECVADAYRPAEALIKMVPADKLEWRPKPNFMSFGQLLYHLADGVGLPLRCLVTGQWPFTSPEQMVETVKLENLPSCGVGEALKKLEADETILRECLDSINEEDFAHKVVSAPWGVKASIERMAINFREHFTNHKMQLFTYLKLLGFPVDTDTLYLGKTAG